MRFIALLYLQPGRQICCECQRLQILILCNLLIATINAKVTVACHWSQALIHYLVAATATAPSVDELLTESAGYLSSISNEAAKLNDF